MRRPRINLAGYREPLVEAVKAYLDEVENRTYSKGMDVFEHDVFMEALKMYCGDDVFDWVIEKQDERSDEM